MRWTMKCSWEAVARWHCGATVYQWGYDEHEHEHEHEAGKRRHTAFTDEMSTGVPSSVTRATW